MIIGLCGAIGSGKTTYANRLIKKHGYWRGRFADPLKNMLKVLGLTNEELDGSLKEVPCDKLGRCTPRHAMQRLGTEWGRDEIYDDIWVDAWKHVVSTRSNKLIVADDVRFPNEAKAVHDVGGKLIRIVRPPFYGFNPKSNFHSSETYRLNEDSVIVNDGSVDDLNEKIDHMLLAASISNIWVRERERVIERDKLRDWRM